MINHSFPSFYELGGCSDSYNFLHGIINSSPEMFNVESSSVVSPRSMAEAKAIAANKSHSEAERRRRKRINGHLATLRNLLPNTIKTDKASLLAEAVRCVRELKKTTSELGATMSEDDDNTDDFMNYMGSNDQTTMKKFIFPSESDELNLSYCNSNNSGTLLAKATICCEDRPEIMMDLRRALSTVQGKIIRAEMATVGGRIKCILWVQMLENGCREEGLGQLRRALKLVMDKANFLAQNMGQDLLGNKRPRLYQC
ncbi:transcription factor bHLH30-like [Nicotiana tabacum]|uniref:Transcription factor bHLH30-like n=2 Tax=Nicotiana TaxID=4085 RepID=A0A1S4BTH5_TOBAC|nr:PREDICTED: transcription factor bHLH30-like isoform X2 [Nicotiana sylvestris]XP_016492181.1 PREDICTED: transcription factor bHLH30-like [Nicotiana tabacum]